MSVEDEPDEDEEEDLPELLDIDSELSEDSYNYE
jgi:hypothetical protein